MMQVPPKPSNAKFNDQQWEAIYYQGENILVAASAGSGKTTVLIERILNHLVMGGIEIDQLLVSTFTEAAAKEMKQRMEIRLKAAIQEQTDRQLQLQLINQLRKLPQAHIQTLHAFCLYLIQTYFYLIECDPNVQLLTDETQKEMIYQEVWQDLLDKIMTRQDSVSAMTPEVLGKLMAQLTDSRSDQHLFKLIKQLYLLSCAQTEPEIWLKSLPECANSMKQFGQSAFYLEALKPQWLALLLQAEQALEQSLALLNRISSEQVIKYEPLLSSEYQQLKLLIEALMADELHTVFTVIQALTFKTWPANSKKSEDYEWVNQMKQYRDQVKSIITQLKTFFVFDFDTVQWVEGHVAASLQALSQLSLAFTQLLHSKKQALNLIDYNDLEHMALDILAPYDKELGIRRASSAAKYYQGHFKEILVDEYQDINEIQAAILYWLSCESLSDLKGNSFMVGDVKQSIYGFRMAEPSLFLKKYQAYQQGMGGHLIVLDQNYRSRDEVLQFTNFIFQQLMDTDFGQMAYTHQAALKTGNTSFLSPEDSEHFKVELLLNVKGVNEEEEDLESDDQDHQAYSFDKSIDQEANLIAKDIYHKIQTGFQIYDKDTKELRPIRYQDIVVLTATKDTFIAFKQACDRYEIPLYTQNIASYFQRHEIQLMVALLKLIDNPLQDIPLVAILRSFMVGLDDEALSRIRINQPQGLFFEACLAFIAAAEMGQLNDADKSISQQLSQFIMQLNNWQRQAKEKTMDELIWHIYQQTHFLDYVAGQSNGVQRQANLHAFYQRAKMFEQSNFKGLFGFVAYIEQMMQYDHDLAEPILLEEDQNMVRIMTVHASKGLEFPLVYLMNMAKRFNLSDTKGTIVSHKRYGVGMDYYDEEALLRYPSFMKRSLAYQHELDLKAEEMRKLYVALTRCEQKLILVGTIKDEASWDQLQETVRNHSKQKLTISTHLRRASSNWLNWIGQALARKGNLAEAVTNFRAQDVLINFVEDSQHILPLQNQTKQLDKLVWYKGLKQALEQSYALASDYQFFHHLLDFNYPHLLAARTSSYQSVSELKRLYEEPGHEKLGYYQDRSQLPQQVQQIPDDVKGIRGIRYTADSFQLPKFMQETSLTYAQIGTLTHYVLQQLDFAAFKNQDIHSYTSILLQQVEGLALQENQKNALKYAHIVSFLQGDLGQLLIQNANQLQREQAFSYLLPASWLLQAGQNQLDVSSLGEDHLLIHGVVDNYLVLADGMILIDYKTDRYQPYSTLSRADQIQLIVDKYRFQVSLYAQALTQAQQLPVQAVYLVLLDFEEVIKVDNLYHLVSKD